MDYNGNSQIHNSTTVWTQPQTDEQRRYYSKHAAEKRVFGWITTVFQGAHAFIAFAAWTAIYIWVFQKIPFLMPVAPFLAGATLLALHVLFRTTWQTYWYDRLDDDPNTDSPVWVPVVIMVILLFAEIQGARQYLTGQVKPPEKQGTDYIAGEHNTALAAIEQAYRNDQAAIESTYKQKERAVALQYDRQIRSARNRSADTAEERRDRANRVATLERQRDAALAPVLGAKADALEKARISYADSKTAANNRHQQALAAIDNANASEVARYTSDLGNVNTYAWVLSVALLILIAGLSYRCVRINVMSGIIPLRNYTVLDAHGSLPERIWTALSDAINRRGLQFAVFLHRILSPRKEITSFDGTVVARPGTYNTPPGFFPTEPAADDLALRQKVAQKIMREATAGKVIITPELLEEELQKARAHNGTYFDTPLGKPEPSQAQARTGEGYLNPAAQHPRPTADEMLEYWRGMVENQLNAYDRYVISGQPGKAQSTQEYILTDPMSPIVKEGQRLGLRWGVHDGQFKVGRRDRSHLVPLDSLTAAALDSPTPIHAEEPDELFKQNVELFKQNILPYSDDAGKVIGVKYKKRDNNWTTYDYNTVRGQWKIYHLRAQKGEISDAVQDGLEKWEYAMSLFEEGRAELERENIHAISL